MTHVGPKYGDADIRYTGLTTTTRPGMYLLVPGQMASHNYNVADRLLNLEPCPGMIHASYLSLYECLNVPFQRRRLWLGKRLAMFDLAH